ncbi:hypothetical protein K450DRAFT_254119 [Umbelopsis ramanniana AG]|uniref:Uncharacterized protein n=1 Tax=Umbelopsis ramanniana AG TaxID=1314678 RepID=A0AAD5E7G5_UMBRA|nr:uncharacterized protein K450DRAFT_254119 [Umbelopsis ramanniana AG]KAI8577045.1 hypothetical protein K450DRAFT_254119 [Umbelopsis ramanniana AG]
MSSPSEQDLYSGLQEALRNQQQWQVQDDLDDIDEGDDAGYLDDSTESSYDADLEWEESKEQINMLLSLVIFPFVGKWLGRKFSFWGKYLIMGHLFSSRFLTPSPFSVVEIPSQLLR